MTPAWYYEERLRFDVVGLAAPQGSKSLDLHGRFPKMLEGSSKSGRVKLERWREAVAAEARRWADSNPPIDAPVTCQLVFRLPRLATMLKRTYRFQTSAPDLDKLCRAVFDALTGIVWRDDSLVVRAVILKRFAELDEQPGCHITVGVVTAGPVTVESPSLFEQDR